MSYNRRYQGFGRTPYNTFQCSNSTSFHNLLVPPPTHTQMSVRAPLSDKEYINLWEERLANRTEVKPVKRTISISDARNKMKGLVTLLDDLKSKEKYLTEKCSGMSEIEWQETLNIIKSVRSDIDLLMMEINDSYLKELQHNLSRRNAKRLRLKRLKIRKAEEKKQMLKDKEERNRKIDENLQKMKDDLEKIKRAEEDKLEADSILRDVFRKKHDAKKCVEKLQALMKLRRARANTAKGRGEKVSEADADSFNRNIEKLIALWRDKQACYDQEESELRLKLTRSAEGESAASESKDPARIHNAWLEAMFGVPDAMPQRDFKGNVAEFVAVRSRWDAYISEEGTPIPVGWLLPQVMSPPSQHS